MYRIRFHGRGGQGMKTASRMLGTMFFLEGFQIQDAPRYGAERRGAPIFAYVRASRKEIKERGVISNPDLIVVADDSLMSIPAAGTTLGCTNRTVALIVTHESADSWSQRLNLEGPVVTLPPPSESQDALAQPYVGAAVAGAAARLIGKLSPESLTAAVRQELEFLSPQAVEENVAVATRSFSSMAEYEAVVQEGQPQCAGEFDRPKWVDSLYEEAQVSAPAILKSMTSVEVRTGLWRTMRPVIDHDRCNRCWWVCSTFCPDSAISVNDEGYPEVDYDHCKGCLICVAKCPPHAIRAIPEGADAEADQETTTP